MVSPFNLILSDFGAIHPILEDQPVDEQMISM
jgi:hypothetical protein